MSLLEVKRIIEKRKYNLINTLDNGREDIELSKQHQMYGAIKELETILKTIDYYREQEIQNHFDLRLSREPSEPFLKRFNFRKKENKLSE